MVKYSILAEYKSMIDETEKSKYGIMMKYAK
jgi:hypothetical protein